MLERPEALFQEAPGQPAPALRVPSGFGGAHLIPFLLGYLERLRLGCSLVSGKDHGVWLALVPHPSDAGPVQFDSRFGRRDARVAYNLENLELARRTRRSVLAERGGFNDIFAPVLRAGAIDSFLVCGPFRRELLSKSEILSLWQALSQRTPRADDPELLAYARAALGAALLEPEIYGATRQLLEVIAKVLAASAPLSAFKAFVARNLALFDRSRATMQGLAQGLVDPMRSATLRDIAFGPQYAALGIHRMFSQVLSLAPSNRVADSEPLSEMVRARAMLQAGAEVARELGETLCGPLGSGGVFFLTSPDAGERIEQRAQRVQREIESATECRVHVGISAVVTRGEHLPRAYDEAGLALQLALHEPRSIVQFNARRRSRAESPYRSKLHELRTAVTSGATATARVAAHAVFREVLWRSGGGVDAVRAHCDGLMLDLLSEVERRSVLEAQSVAALEKSCLERLAQARSVAEVDLSLSHAAELLSQAVRQPFHASKSARIDAARRFVDDNARQKLRVSDVARRAGLSKNYFSTLFRRHTGERFEVYLLLQRLELARGLLLSTRLPVAQVGRDSGFPSAVHFSRAFKQKYAEPPARYRALHASDRR